MMGQGLIQMPRPLGKGRREIVPAPEDADSGAKEEADKQRRKIQNRKNQRAHRQRLKGKEGGRSSHGPRPFKVTRWRLDELELEPQQPVDVRSSDETSSPASEGTSSTHARSPGRLHTSPTGSSSSPPAEQAIIPIDPQLTTVTNHHHHVTNQPSPSSSSAFTFPLSSDHLLHLIHFNVLRALLTNKLSLNLYVPLGVNPTSIACPISEVPAYRHQHHHEHHHDSSTNPLHLDIEPDVRFPPSLAPTPLQRNHNHPIWVNAIPFPRVRDNFIRHSGLFNPWELLYDLVGDFMNNTPPACVKGHAKPTTAAVRAARGSRPSSSSRVPGGLLPPPGGSDSGDDGGVGADCYDDEVTAGRRGLIVWGEPHEAQSWEATPGFLARWAWAVEGCEEELVASSNRWRVRRGEEPIRLSVVRR